MANEQLFDHALPAFFEHFRSEPSQTIQLSLLTVSSTPVEPSSKVLVHYNKSCFISATVDRENPILSNAVPDIPQMARIPHLTKDVEQCIGVGASVVCEGEADEAVVRIRSQQTIQARQLIPILKLTINQVIDLDTEMVRTIKQIELPFVLIGNITIHVTRKNDTVVHIFSESALIGMCDGIAVSDDDLSTAQLESSRYQANGGTECSLKDQIAQLWKQHLRKDVQINGHTNFFAAGGHSLLAFTVALEISSLVGFQIPVDIIFDYETVEELAMWIEEQEEYDNHYHIEGNKKNCIQQLSSFYYPLSPQQQQMYFLHHMDRKSYNQIYLQRYAKDINIQKLHEAFLFHVQHQEGLRLSFFEAEEEPKQFILSATESYFGLSLVQAKEEEIQQKIKLEQANVIRLTEGSPIRITIFGSETYYTVCFILHHILTDGVSSRITENDVNKYYQQLINGDCPRIGRSGYNYLLYAESVQKTVKIIPPDVVSALSLSLQQPLEVSSMFGGRRTVEGDPFTIIKLPHEYTSHINDFATNSSQSPFVAFLGALCLTLHSLSGKTHITVGAPSAGRDGRTWNMVGYFINNLVFTSAYSRNVRQFISNLGREEKALVKANIPYVSLVSAMRRELKSGLKQLFEVYINCRYDLQSQEGSQIEQSETTKATHEDTTIFPLEVDVDLASSGYEIKIRIKNGCGNQENVRALSESYFNQLRVILKEFNGSTL